MFLVAEVLILAFGLILAIVRQSAGPVMLPLRVVALLYVDVFRGIPTILVIYAVGFGLPALDLTVVSTQDPAVYGVIALTCVVLRVRQRGLPRRNQLSTAGPGQRRPFDRAHPAAGDAARDPPASGPHHHPGAEERLHQPAEGHRARLRARLDRGQPRRGIYRATVFNYSSYVVAAALFLILTIPLARFTDRLIARDRARRLAGGVQ